MTRNGFRCAAVATGLFAIWLLSAPFDTAHGQTANRPAVRPSATAAALKPGDLDTTASRAYIFVGKTGFGHDHAIEGHLKSGHINLGAEQDAGEIVFNMASFDADTLTARRFIGLSGATDASTRKQVNANMLGPAVLDVRRFPTATFRIDSSRPLSRNSRSGNPLYQLQGRFTLHGVTRNLSVTAEAVSESGGTRLRGQFSIFQTHYGMTPFSKAFGAVGVTDKLVIHGDLRLAGAARVAAGR